ncbi:hypothetical protein FRC01_002714 [Tulasnella sp. 417]|nr:hypothetical protein FRC01_002714 [Tulasnella sp. 417]
MAYGLLPGGVRVALKMFDISDDIGHGYLMDLPQEAEKLNVTWGKQRKALSDEFEKLLDASEKLRHPHIVPVLGFRVNIENPYLIQPRYISMEQWLQRHPETKLSERLQWLHEAANGLRHLHEARLDAIPWHGQVHLNNILLRPVQDHPMVAAISDAYHLRAARHAYQAVHGFNCHDKYPKGLQAEHLYFTPELLRDETWDGSQSEDVCAFGLSILHAITRDWPVSIKVAFTLDMDNRMIWRTPNPYDYPDSLPAEDPLWNLLYPMFRTADQRPKMARVAEETTLDAEIQTQIHNLLVAEVSNLELGLKINDDLPLVSETQFARVRRVRLKEPDGRVSDVAVKEIKVRLINSSVKETEDAVRGSRSTGRTRALSLPGAPKGI